MLFHFYENDMETHTYGLEGRGLTLVPAMVGCTTFGRGLNPNISDSEALNVTQSVPTIDDVGKPTHSSGSSMCSSGVPGSWFLSVLVGASKLCLTSGEVSIVAACETPRCHVLCRRIIFCRLGRWNSTLTCL
jgi:hypothetical protein